MTDIKDYNAEVMLAMTSIANQIIDPPTVVAAKKLEDWPQWQASIENKLYIHKKLGTGELVTPLPNANINSPMLQARKGWECQLLKIKVNCTGIHPTRRDQLQ